MSIFTENLDKIFALICNILSKIIVVICCYININNKGTMDGVVAVYNVMLPPSTPQYKSSDVVEKHGGLVWEVC